MAENWQDDSTANAEIKDDGDIPDDWEAELEEKPKETAVQEESKEASKSAVTAKTSKKKSNDIPASDKTTQEIDDERATEQKDQTETKNNDTSPAETAIDQRSLEDLNLVTRDEFAQYSSRLCNRLGTLSKSEFYPELLDSFVEGLTKSMSIEDVKHLQATVQAIYLRKQSDDREKKAKSKTKRAAKPQLRTGRRRDYDAFADEENPDLDLDNDYDDDFM